MTTPLSPRTEDRRRPKANDVVGALAPLLGLWAAGLLVIAAVLVQDQVPAEDLFMDATFVGQQPWYVGLVAALGMVAWTASVCFCFIAGWVAGLAGRARAKSAFRGGGLLFALLLLDDLFLFHSDLLPRALGLPKVAVLGIYAVLGLVWTTGSAQELIRTRVQFLVGAAIAFGISLTVEVIFPGSDTGVRGALEDGAKFLGILALALWASTSATDVIRSVVNETRRSRQDDSAESLSV
ncbi:MAG: hypothetical protein KJO07_00120 [Deltaproteobacteria bacterium]|nr:hypothetical protein [Deltaproteobacteria bacterium]